MNRSNQDASTRRAIRKTVLILLALITVFVSLFVYKISQPRVLSDDELRANGAIVFSQPRIINDFTLIDSTGKEIGLDTLKGKWSLIFFGFTQCPDICPQTLSSAAQMYEQLDDALKAKTQLVFVSLDPARDKPEVISKYLSYFHEELIGVTGEFLSILKFARNVNVAFSKVNTENGYTIDHSSNLILVDPQGNFAGFFKAPIESDKLLVTYRSITLSR